MSLTKTFEMAFVVGAALQANFATVMEKATKSTSRLESAVKNLQRRSSEISAITKQQQATERARLEWRNASSQLEKLERNMLGMRNPSDSVIRDFNRLETASTKAKVAWLEQKNALAMLKQQAGLAGSSFDRLSKKQANLQKRLETARKGQENLAGGSRMIRSSNGYAAATGMAIFSKMAGAVRTGADFDSAMARVGAVSGASGEDLSALRQQAKELGKSTVWSSSQAAEGQQFLAMAGFSKDQILQAMPGMLDLASAGGIDLGSAADIGSNILTGLGLDASEMGRLGDVLTNTFTKSNTSLAMLGETMKYAAPVAKSLGVTLEEASAMAGKLGDAGIQGSMAGTTLRSVMLRLSTPSKQGADALNELGVKTTDASGNMRKMPDILADLDRAMANMSESAKASYTKAIFETEAMSGAFVLMEQAGKGALQEFTDSISKSGTAKEVAAKQNNNLTGDFKALTSAIEGLTIAFYEKLEPSLRTITQTVAQAISVVTKYLEKHKEIALVVGVAGGAIGAFAAAAMPVFTLFKTGCFLLGLLKTAFGAARIAMAAFNLVLTANPLGAVIAGITAAIAAGVALYENWDLVKGMASQTWEAIKSAFSGLGSFMEGVFQTAASAVKTPLNAIIAMVNTVIQSLNSISVDVPSWVPKIGGQKFGFNIAEIPMLASGGIVTSPTVAVVGEGGESEAVIPLSRISSLLGGTGMGSVSVNFAPVINVSGSGDTVSDVRGALNAGKEDLKRELERLMADQRRISFA